MNLFSDLAAELELTMVPSLRAWQAPTMHVPASEQVPKVTQASMWSEATVVFSTADFGAYLETAHRLPHDYFCFLNSFTEIVAPHWLASRTYRLPRRTTTV